jgi:hypothetical protein
MEEAGIVSVQTIVAAGRAIDRLALRKWAKFEPSCRFVLICRVVCGPVANHHRLPDSAVQLLSPRTPFLLVWEWPSVIGVALPTVN